MTPVFTALVPALQIHWGSWWASGSNETYAGHGGYGGYGGHYGSGSGSWS